MTPQIQTLVLFIFNVLLGLLLGLTAYNLRRLIAQSDENTKDITEIKLKTEKYQLECKNCQANMLTETKMMQIMKAAIYEALMERELNWLNEGRIMPKYRLKKTDNQGELK
jgi:cell division protein FtsB